MRTSIKIQREGVAVSGNEKSSGSIAKHTGRIDAHAHPQPQAWYLRLILAALFVIALASVLLAIGEDKQYISGVMPSNKRAPSPIASVTRPIAASTLRGLDDSPEDLYAFYLTYTPDTPDPGASRGRAYFLATALETCFETSRLDWDGYITALGTSIDAEKLRELSRCRGFVGQPIAGDQIVALLGIAAADGDPRARARMLLFRDIGASLDETDALVAELLLTGDPAVIENVGAYLGRRELAAIAEARESRFRQIDSRLDTGLAYRALT